MAKQGGISLKKEFIKDIVAIVLFPLMVAIIAIVFFFINLFPTISVIQDGGRIAYSDELFAKYRDEQYEEHFGESSAKEDNLLIIFLINEDYNKYYCVAKLGTNVDKNISSMFGNDSSSFGKVVLSTINEEYGYSFGSDVKSVVDQMAVKITDLKLASSFKE